jgi:hypothetical protein
MMDEQPIGERLRGALHAYAETYAPPPGSHPSPEELRQYHAASLEPDRVEEIRIHLALCPECSQRLLSIADVELSDEAQGEEAVPGKVPEDVLRAAMSVLDEELGARRAASIPEPARAPGPLVERARTAWFRRAFVPLAAAAVILLGVNAVLLMRSPAGTVPRGDLDLAQLRPVDRVVRGAEDGMAEAVLPAMLLLATGDVRRLERYDAELAPVSPPDAPPVATVELQQTTTGGFRIFLPAGSVQPGLYRITLRGHGAGGSEDLQTYEVRVLAGSADGPHRAEGR